MLIGFPLLLWAWESTGQIYGTIWLRRPTHLMAERIQKETIGPGAKYPLQGYYLNKLAFFHRTHVLKVLPTPDRATG